MNRSTEKCFGFRARGLDRNHRIAGGLKIALAAGVSFLCAFASDAAEYFVDRNGGDDAYDGTAAEWAGGDSLVGPKRSIQAAVDLADGSGTVVTIMPGVYDNGGGEPDDGSWPHANRVLLKANNITLRSSTGKAADVHIVGVRSTADGNEHGIGAGSMRCIASKKDLTGCVVSGITFRDGCGKGDDGKERGGGIHSVSSGSITVIDCVVSNCACPRGGGAYNVNAHSTLFTGNYANAAHGSAMNLCRAANCLIVYNSTDCESPLSYMQAVVNCTVANNGGSAACLNSGVQRDSTLICNTLGFGQADNGSNDDAISSNSVLCATATFTGSDEDTVTGVAGEDQCVSPVLGNFRPLPGGECIGRGRGEHQLLVPLPEGYTYHDMDGVEVPTTGPVNVGAYQTPSPSPAGARIDFGIAAEVEGAPYVVRAGSDWITPTNWPVTYRVRPVHENPYALYFEETEEMVDGKLLMRHAMYDGWTAITPSPDPAATNTLALAVSGQTFYADADNGSDEYDGTAAEWAGEGSLVGPKKTLQAAVSLVTESYGIVYAAPGVYDEGGVSYGGVSNRVLLTGKHIGLIASGGQGSATIAGAPDPDTGGSGPNSWRCVCAVSDYSFVQGFKLSGGYSSESTSKYRASAYWSNKTTPQILDCTVSGNVGLFGVAAGWTAQRTRFLDNSSTSRVMFDGARAVSCVFAGNAATDGAIVAGSSKLYGCTLDCNGYEGVDGTVEYTGCVFLNLPDSDGYADDASGNVVCEENYFADADGRDYRIGSMSPACDAVTSDIMAAGGLFRLLVSDVDGRDMAYSSGGAVDAGGVRHMPRIPMYMVAAEGGSVGLAGDIPMYGCVTEPTEFTAIATGARERPFKGFSVNGEMQPLASTTHVFTVSAESGTALVKAVYGTDWYVDATSGDDDDHGSTPESARRTLAAVAQYAVSGDTIHAAEGTYDDGEMLHDEVAIGGEPSVPSRVWVKEGVTLAASGAAERTFIKGEAATSANRDYLDNGSDAVRCVRLSANATVRGFTLTGGHTETLADSSQESRTDDDTLGGAVLGSEYASSLVEDCIVTDNAAGWGTAGYKCTFRRCTITDNMAQTRAAAGRQCRYYGCLIDGNSGSSQLDTFYAMDSCTIGTNAWDASGTEEISSSINNSSAYFVNSIILAPKVSDDTRASNCVFRSGCGVSEGNLVNCTVADLDAIAFESGYRPMPSANVAVDRADDSLSDLEAVGITDLSGVQRVMNGTRDIGALEADWRPVYAADIGKRCTVSEVSPEVRETDGRTVFLPAGAISGRVDASQALRTYRVTARVTGNGVLTLYEGDAERAVFEAGEEQEILFRPESLPLDFRFAYVPGEADVGGAEILGLGYVAGTVISLR